MAFFVLRLPTWYCSSLLKTLKYSQGRQYSQVFYGNHKTFSIFWRCPKINFTGTVLKTQQPKYSKFDENFDIQRPVQMTWSAHQNDIIVDDRLNITVGKKLKEAKQTGYSHIVLFGKECILEKNPVIELHSGKDMIKMSVNQVMYHFETIQNSI